MTQSGAGKTPDPTSIWCLNAFCLAVSLACSALGSTWSLTGMTWNWEPSSASEASRRWSCSLHFAFFVLVIFLFWRSCPIFNGDPHSKTFGTRNSKTDSKAQKLWGKGTTAPNPASSSKRTGRWIGWSRSCHFRVPRSFQLLCSARRCGCLRYVLLQKLVGRCGRLTSPASCCSFLYRSIGCRQSYCRRRGIDPELFKILFSNHFCRYHYSETLNV